MVKLYLVEEEVEAVVDTGTSAAVVGQGLAPKLARWNGGRKVQIRQGDGSCLEGNFVVNTTWKVIDSSLVLGKFAMDTKVLDIGNRFVSWRSS